MDASRLQGFRILKSEWFATLEDVTSGDSGLMFGVCHDLTTAEIVATFDADPQRAGDPTESENALRPVWGFGVMSANDGGGVLHDKGEWKPQWSFPEGTELRIWARNTSADIWTTGAQLNLVQKIYGVWLKD